MKILNTNINAAESWFTPEMEVSSHHASRLIGDCENTLAWGTNHILTHAVGTSQQLQCQFCEYTLCN